jgi:hypothetical protein
MPIDPQLRETLAFITQVAQAYASLMHRALPGDESLGGSLLFAGELKNEGRALIVAGNIAGAASLAATADVTAQKQAIRDGAVDFLVTNLDEALRILKNEIRKREPVSVAVSVAPESIVNEMLDRGVLPDLLPPQPRSGALEPSFAAFIEQGARSIAAASPEPIGNLFIWQTPEEFAQRPTAFDALLKEHVSQGDNASLRWLRLSPRYLGPQARRLRSLICDEETASKLIEKIGPPLKP